MAVDDRLQIDSPDTLENTDKKSVHSHEIAGVFSLDMPLTVFRTEAFQQPDLSVTEFKVLLADRFFESQQTIMTAQEIMPRPDATDTSCADLDTLQDKLLSNA